MLLGLATYKIVGRCVWDFIWVIRKNSHVITGGRTRSKITHAVGSWSVSPARLQLRTARPKGVDKEPYLHWATWAVMEPKALCRVPLS